MTREMWDSIEKLSELRSEYSCLDEEEQPYYHALSLGIEGIKALEQKGWRFYYDHGYAQAKRDLQEPCEDIKEIEEVMNCDADAETKCKMISNILTAKPHYFKEQEPCEDAISLQAVIDMTGLSEWFDSSDSYNDFVIALCDLPSVTPKPKTGHWIRMKAFEKWECSQCNTVFRFTFKEHDYCPNCGCCMVEPQESEG